MWDQLAAVDWEYGELSARVYQLDKPVGKSLGGDIEFYRAALAGIDGPVLEPAVGTGRMLIPLLRDGVDVTGYDTSPHMLQVCRQNLAAAGVTAEVFRADMTTHRDPDRYAAVLIPTGSIILLPDRDTVRAALAAARDSLTAGGRLYVDVPAFDPTTAGPMRHWWDGEHELLTLQIMHVDVDRVRQRVVSWQRYELWRDGRLVDTQLQRGAMQWFGLPEFTGLLRDAGFDDIEVVGDHGDAVPDSDSSIWTFVATK